jgi:hypothetical protein
MKKQVKTYESIVAPQQKTMLLSVFSYLNDYHLCWEINQKFNINLTRYDDFTLIDHDLGVRKYSVYAYESEIEKRTYILISNKSDNGPMVAELAKVDYLFRVTGYIDSNDEHYFTSQFRTIDSVLTTMNTSKYALPAKVKRVLNEIFANFE